MMQVIYVKPLPREKPTKILEKFKMKRLFDQQQRGQKLILKQFNGDFVCLSQRNKYDDPAMLRDIQV